MKKIFMLSLVIGAAGCTVQQAEVPHQAFPVTRPELKLAKDLGRLKPSQFSIFLWPENSTTGDRSAVRQASKEIDKLFTESAKNSKEIAALEASFSNTGLDCVVRFAVLGPEDDPEFIDWVESWKAAESVDEANPDSEVVKRNAERQSCIENQDRRKNLLLRRDQIGREELPKKALAIDKIIDPTYPKIENKKTIDGAGSLFYFGVDDSGKHFVEIKLKNFLGSDKVVTSKENSHLELKEADLEKMVDGWFISDVSWDPESRRLAFWVSEGPGSTGRYQFVLERTADFLGGPRFLGDLKYVKDGAADRTGSVKIDGTWR